jgi:hypothetical protein
VPRPTTTQERGEMIERRGRKEGGECRHDEERRATRTTGASGEDATRFQIARECGTEGLVLQNAPGLTLPVRAP